MKIGCCKFRQKGEKLTSEFKFFDPTPALKKYINYPLNKFKKIFVLQFDQMVEKFDL